MKYITYPIMFLLMVSVASALTVQQLVDSYDYNYFNGSINVTQYANGMIDTNGNSINDTLVFNLTVVPFVTGEYDTIVILSNNQGVWTSNTEKTLTTTGLVQVNFSTFDINGTAWNYTIRIFDVNDVAVFEKYKQNSSTYSNYENGTSIKTIMDSNLNNDMINLTLVLNVSRTETVNVTAFLRYNTTNNINTSVNNTISARTEATLTNGQEVNVTILFDNETIKATHYNGTFVLETVVIGNKTIAPTYTTAAYNYEDFAKTSYFKVYNHSFVDNNANGLYEFLVFNITLNIKQADTYNITGTLYDLFENQVINFSETKVLSVGNNSVNISINGSQIYQSYIDGPYLIKYMILKNSSNNVTDIVIEPYATNSTSINDYELPKLPDLQVRITLSTDQTTAQSNITVNITNQGSAAAVGIIVDLLDNTSVIRKNETIAILDVNGWQTFNYTITNMNSTNLSYVAIVDLFDSIDELNESNNVDTYPRAPTFENNTYNPTNPRFSTPISFNITLKDEFNGSYYIFSYNNGSGFINDSAIAWNGTNQTRVEVNKTLTGKQGTVVQWLWYANDTENAVGVSDTYNLTIANTNATVETPVFNVTTVTEISGIKANSTYRDVDNANGSLFFTWYRNGSNIFTDNYTNIAPTTIVNTTLSNTLYAKGDRINISVIANDTVENTTINFSTTLTVANTAPTHATPILNTSTGTNRTTDNLTLYNISTYDADSDTSKNIVNWRRNSTSLLLLNVPMDGGSNLTNTRDYSDFNHSVRVYNSTWFRSAGYDGFGAYNFSVENNTFMNISYNQIFNTSAWTVEAWVYPHSAYATGGVFIGKWKSAAEQDQYQLGYLMGNKFRCGANNFTGFQLITSAALSPKNWYHVACTYDGNTLSLYVNGTLQNSSTIGTIKNNDAELQIGCRRADQCFNGTVDDVRIWNATLTWQQINNSFLSRTNEMHSSMLVEGQTWNATLTPNDHDADGDTKVSNSVTIRFSPMQDPPILNATTTSNFTIDNLTVYNISTFDLEGDAIKNIISWYRNNTPLMIFSSPAEGGSTIFSTKDYSGQNLSINVVNASWSNSSGYDGFGAYNFSKNNPNNKTFLNVSHNTAFNVTSWTIMAWTYPHSSDPAGGVVVGKWKTSEQDQWQLAYIAGNKFRCGANNFTGFQFITSSAFSSKNWYHIVCTYNGTDITLYVNGTLRNSTRVGTIRNNDAELQIGCRRADQCFNGSVDDVQIWNGTLTWEQINNSFNNRTTQMHYSMTVANQTWNTSITPNDKGRDGQTLFSNSVAIQKVPITLITGAGGDILNSTTYRTTESILEQPVERLNSTNYTTTIGIGSIIG